MIGRAALRAISRGAGRSEIVTLEPAHLDLDIAPVELSITDADLMSAEHAADGVPSTRSSGDLALKPALDAYQRHLIRQALLRCNDNWAAAARALDIDSSNLHKLARRLGIKA